jgi:hypothetical protein
MSMRIFPLAGIAVLAGLALAGCTKTNPTGYTPADLAALPEVALLPPGAEASKLLLINGRDGPTVDVATRVSWEIGTDEYWERVLEFYGRELEARGWALRGTDRISTDIAARRWDKGDFSYSVDIRDRSVITAANPLSHYKTVAEVSIAAFGKK